MTQSEPEIKFMELKTKLQSYEDTEKIRLTKQEDNIMKSKVQPIARLTAFASNQRRETADIILIFIVLSVARRDTMPEHVTVNSGQITVGPTSTRTQPAEGGNGMMKRTQPQRKAAREWQHLCIPDK
ncbi:hypothetical protein GOODEAATRI_026351 [Goodea atripinnis]|uniref:Uncharacterized protein n=1 Tax=Goodea atripinnis TaxID=208336 RepID=A0ABV0NDU9_9TELE